MFKHIRSFIHTRPHFFPCLRNMNARTHRLRFNRHIIVLQFRYPYVIAIIEANKEKIRFSIFINKQGLSIIFSPATIGFFSFCLNGPNGESAMATDVFVCRIIHIKLPVDLVNLRCPEGYPPKHHLYEVQARCSFHFLRSFDVYTSIPSAHAFRKHNKFHRAIE